jgi:PAS domain S-box-containing protein
MKNEDKSKSSLLAEIESLNARLRSLESQTGETSSPNWEAETHLFRITAEAAPVGIFIVQGTRFVYVNSALAEATGLDPSDMIGREFWLLVHPDDQAMVRERGQARQRGGTVPGVYEVRFVGAAGQTRWAEFRGTEIQFEGKPAILGFVHDITERKEVERLLETSEKKYRTLIESAGEAIFSVDRNGIFLFMNTEAARQLGGHPDDFVGKSQWDVFPKWLADRQMIKVRKVFETGQGFAREVTTVMQGKEHIHHTTGVPVRNVEGEITSVLGIARDITDLYEARCRLQRSEENYRRFIENLPVGVFQSTPEGKVLSGNPALAHQYGYGSVEEYLTIPAEDTWADPEQRREWVKLVEQKGTVNDYEVRLKRKDGVYIWVSVSAQGVFDDNHKLLFIDGVEVDLTARRKAEEALRRTGESMRALLNAPSQIMLIIDAKGTILALNDAAAKETGLSIEVALGTCAFDHMTDDTASLRKEHFEEVFRTGQPVQFDEYLGERSFETTLYPVFGDDRQVEAIVVSSIDVSDTRRALDDLRESEEKYRNLFENAQAGVLRSTLDGSRLLAVNRHLADILGYSVEELLSIPLYLIWRDSSDRSRLMHLLRENGYVRDFELEVRTRSGECRNVLTSLRLYRDSGIIEGSVIDITERLKSERALRESEELFRAVADTAPVAIVINQGDKVVYANRFAMNAVGMNSSELGKVSFLEFVHPDHQDMVRETSQARQRGEAVPQVYEVKIVARSGEEFWALLSGSPIEYQGKPEALGIAVDITERKQTEETLRLLTHRLSIATESAGIGVWDLDLKKNHLVWDKRMYQMYGVFESEFGGAYETWQRSVHPDDLERVSREVSEAVSRTKDFHTSFRIVVPDGHVRHIEAHALVLGTPDGKPDRMVGVNLDITERKLMVERLRESGERFRRITERSFDAIYHVDMDGMLTYASPAAERIAGYRPDEVIGRHVSEFISEKHLPAVGRALAITATGQVVEGLQFEIIASDGHLVFVEANATPIIHDDRVVATQAIVRDISARRQAEQMLEQAYEEQSRQLRQVAGGIAHDIYNDLFPVSAVIHKLRQRLGRPEDPDRERNLRLLQLMDGAVSRAIDMTETVSFYSKLQRDSAGTSARVRKVLDAVLGLHQGRLDQLVVTAVVEVPDALEVACSERNLNSLLTNLLLNALDAMAASKQPSLSVTARRTNGEVEIVFGDNGSGISPDVLPRIFDPFFSTKPNAGTGLGLAIVKRVVDICGGKVKVNSTVDIGTTFHILLPGDVGT